MTFDPQVRDQVVFVDGPHSAWTVVARDGDMVTVARHGNANITVSKWNLRWPS